MKNKNSGQSNKILIVILSIVVVLCLAGAALLVLHIRNTEEKPIDGIDTTETDNTDTETEIENSKPEFEISEDGVLTAYNGEAETVVIPDNVISIGADAFGASPYAEDIKTVKLGKSVEDIDVQALVSLTKLENVEVPEGNSNFISGDGVLIKTDNSVFFCMPSIIKDDYDMFDVFFDVISYKIDGTGESKLVSGGMVAGIDLVFAEEEMKDLLNSKYKVYCNFFTANNHLNQFDELIVYKHTHGLPNSKITCVYDTNEGIVFSNTDNYGFGNTWIFTDDNILNKEVIYKVRSDNKIGEEAWYNYSIIKFMKGNDGTLKYTRIPMKFQFMGGTFDYIWYCTGLNEFAGEEGIVKIQNGEISYYPENSWIVNDVMAGEYLKEMYDAEINGYKTLEEYLEHNAEIYESAK